MWVFKSLSALLFLTGWTALVVAAVGTWFYITVHVITSLGWFLGLVVSVGSVAATIYWEEYVKVPFILWMQAWQYADRMILDRDR